jgi:hypothetical protein
MARRKKIDGVVVAVRYMPDDQVEWVRIYERRGAVYADRMNLPRQDLIDRIKAGKCYAVGQRQEFLAGTFELHGNLRVHELDGQDFVSLEGPHLPGTRPSDRDFLKGVPQI